MGAFLLALSWLALVTSVSGARSGPIRATAAQGSPLVNLEGKYIFSAERNPCGSNPQPFSTTVIIWDWSRSGSYDGEARLPGGKMLSVSGVESRETVNDGLPHITMNDPTGLTGGVLNGVVGNGPGLGTGAINLWDPIPCYPGGTWLSMDGPGVVPRGIGGKVTMDCAASCSANGEPLADVPVTVRGRGATYHLTTADNGTFWVMTKKGQYSVTPRLHGFRFAPGHRNVSVNRPVKNVEFVTGCTVKGKAVASAASVWNVFGGGDDCPNKVGVHYTPASNKLVVGWYANLFRCHVDLYSFTTSDFARYIVDTGHVVGLQPGDQVSRTKEGGVTARVNNNGSFAMDISISPGGKNGTADLSSPLVITYTNQNGALVTCSPVQQTVDLSP